MRNRTWFSPSAPMSLRPAGARGPGQARPEGEDRAPGGGGRDCATAPVRPPGRRAAALAGVAVLGLATSAAAAESGAPAPWRIVGGVETSAEVARLGPRMSAQTPEPLQTFRLTFRMRCAEACPRGLLIGAPPPKRAGPAYFLSFDAADAGRAYRASVGPDGELSDLSPLVLAPSPLAKRMPGYVRREPIAALPPPAAVATQQAHEVEIVLHDGALGGKIGGRRLPSFEIAEDPLYGRIAVIGPERGSVELSDLRVEDLVRGEALPPERTDPGFSVRRLSDLFHSEGVAVGDVTHDGAPDIVAGPNIYLGPDFRRVLRFQAKRAVAPNYYANNMMQYVVDPDGDGWGDILQIGLSPPAAVIYRNPRGQSRAWSASQILPAVNSEATALTDLFGEGRPALVMLRAGAGGAEVGYAAPDPQDPFGPWVFNPVSSPGSWGPHGIGAGDVNGDGRPDVLHAQGWFEQPARPGKTWAFHPHDFGAGAEMFAYDVDGDGLNDVVTSLNAHGWGLACFRQRAAAEGGGFERHEILSADGREPDAVSQLHALAVADLDGDGLKDIVTGKRWWGHLDTDLDPDPDGEPRLYRFMLSRRDGVRFTPTLMHSNAPVGVQLATADVDRDGRTDVVVSARKGVFLFLNRLPGRASGAKGAAAR